MRKLLLLLHEYDCQILTVIARATVSRTVTA
jgi:hypothetical protein